MTTFWTYMDFYQNWILNQWNNMGPLGYGCVLIAIGVGGYFMMGTGFKRM